MHQGHIGIERFNLPAHLSQYLLRSAGGVHQEHRTGAVGLEERQVHEGLAVLTQTSVFARFYDTDDFAALWLAEIQGQAPPDRILAWPKTLGHGLVDDDLRRAVS